MTITKTLPLTALAVCLASSTYAHHSHPYFYDACKSVTIEGRVERVEFKDPHTVIVLRLDDGAGYIVDWAPQSRLTTDAPGCRIRPGEST
jgi:hypothetical protein